MESHITYHPNVIILQRVENIELESPHLEFNLLVFVLLSIINFHSN